MSRFNSVGVKNFSNIDAGVKATADTLRLNYYTELLKALRSNENMTTQLYTPGVVKGLASWGGSSYPSKIQRIYNLISDTIPIKDKEDKNLVIDYHSYNEPILEKGSVTSVEEILKLKNETNKLWVNINGLNHTESIEKLCNELNINALSIADVVHVGQRPKVDENDNYVFTILKMLQYDAEGNLNSEQVSFILGHNFLLTFQESEGDVFNGVRERLQITPSRIRSFKQDYLLYALIDAIVDHYYLVIETLGNKVETLEDQLFIGKSADHVTSQIQ